MFIFKLIFCFLFLQHSLCEYNHDYMIKNKKRDNNHIERGTGHSQGTKVGSRWSHTTKAPVTTRGHSQDTKIGSKWSPTTMAPVTARDHSQDTKISSKWSPTTNVPVTRREPVTKSTENPSTITELPVTTTEPVTKNTENPASSTEVPVTTTESGDHSTSTKNAPTTTEVPVTTTDSNDAPCPANSSAFSKSDIYTIISQSPIIKNNSFWSTRDKQFQLAEKVADILAQNIKNYLVSLKNQPQHLKHILNDIAELRINLALSVKQLIAQSEEYSSLELEFKSKSIKTSNILKSYEKFKKICELNCGDKKLNKVSAFFAKSDDKYCSTLDDLNKKINEALEPFVQSYPSSLLESIRRKEKKYLKIIYSAQKNVEDIAVKYFGNTMYKILNLEDLYHHYKNMVNDIHIDVMKDEIKTQLSEIDIKNIELDRNVRAYSKHCLSCSSSRRRSRSVQTNYLVPRSVGQTPASGRDILKEQLGLFFSLIALSDLNRMEATFKNLDQGIVNITSTDKIIESLQHIQQRIEAITDDEKEQLDNLMIMMGTSPISNVYQLEVESKQLLVKINEALNDIPDFTPH